MDDAQSIYGERAKGFSFRSVGIAAAGRTKILKRNYRNTQDMNVPFHWLRDAASRSFYPAHPSVKLITPHSSKGLQYRVAIIGGVGFWPYQSEADEARLLYVAMTRATHELMMTSSRSSRFSERLKGLCA